MGFSSIYIYFYLFLSHLVYLYFDMICGCQLFSLSFSLFLDSESSLPACTHCCHAHCHFPQLFWYFIMIMIISLMLWLLLAWWCLPLRNMHMLNWVQLSEMVSSSTSNRGFSDPICCPLDHAIQHIFLLPKTSVRFNQPQTKEKKMRGEKIKSHCQLLLLLLWFVRYHH